MYRKRDLLAVGEIYHIFTRSIAEYRVFNNDDEFLRMKATIRYYQIEKPPVKFSRFIQSTSDQGNDFDSTISFDKEKLVQIIAYCLMPDHLHILLQAGDMPSDLRKFVKGFKSYCSVASPEATNRRRDRSHDATRTNRNY